MATAMQGPEVQRLTRQPGGGTSPPRAERLAPLTGIAVLLLGLAGLIVWEGPADRPEWDAPRGVILTYFGDRDTVIFGSFLLMLAAVFFLWFVGSLRAVLRRAEGDVGRLSAIAYGGGLAAAAFMLAMPASNVLGALYAKQLSPEGAQTFFLFGNVFLYPAAMAAAVLVAATALVALRTGALPRWLAWLSLVLALWLLIPPLGSGAGTPENPAAWTGLAALPGVPVWTAVTAVVLMLKSRDR
jgi:hypothetical protein